MFWRPSAPTRLPVRSRGTCPAHQKRPVSLPYSLSPEHAKLEHPRLCTSETSIIRNFSFITERAQSWMYPNWSRKNLRTSLQHCLCKRAHFWSISQPECTTCALRPPTPSSQSWGFQTTHRDSLTICEHSNLELFQPRVLALHTKSCSQ